MSEKARDVRGYIEVFGDWDVRERDGIHGHNELPDISTPDVSEQVEPITFQDQQALDQRSLEEVRLQLDRVG